MARSRCVVVVVRAAADDAAVFDGGVARFERGGGDGQAADAGAGHAAGAGVAGHVAPGAVVVLRAAPVVGGELPGLAADFGADALGVVQGEHGELRVAVVAARARDTTRQPLRSASLIWWLSSQRTLRPMQQHVLLRLGGAEDHRLQRDGVGFVELEAAEVVERLANGGIVGRDAGIQQRQRAQSGDAAVVAGHFAPAAARRLFALQIGDAAVDGGEHLGGVDGPVALAAAREPTCGRYNRYDRHGREPRSATVECSFGIPSRSAAASIL